MNKPYIRLPHIILEAVGAITTIIALIYAIIVAVTVKEEIPTHYNFQGEIDGYGSASVLLILPIIMFFVVGLLIVLNHLLPPSQWNIPFKILPGREVPVFYHCSLMVTEITAEIGILALVETLLFMNPNVNGLIVTTVYIVIIFISIFVEFVMMHRVNR